MSDANPHSPAFAAVGVITLGGRELMTAPVAFDLSGVHMVLRRSPEGEGFEVITTDRREPGVARFEKICMEPVAFFVRKNGQPYWRVDVKGMSDSMALDLTAEV